MSSTGATARWSKYVFRIPLQFTDANSLRGKVYGPSAAGMRLSSVQGRMFRVSVNVAPERNRQMRQSGYSKVIGYSEHVFRFMFPIPRQFTDIRQADDVIRLALGERISGACV